jgi:2'-5' RNA ligase
MNDLARRIDLHSAELGFEPEIKIFKPHLTLARIRDPRGAREIARSHVANDFGPVQFTCSELVLYESHIDKAGSLHEKLHAAGFGA